MEEEIIVIEDDTEEEIITIEEAIEKVYPELQDKTITPTREEQKIKADSGIYGLNEITIEPVTNEIDENIKSENIKSGISILGIEGNVVELVGEEITIQPKSYEQEIVPTAPKNGFTKVIVNAQSGVDINDYFETNYTGGNYIGFIKKVPNKILIKGTSCSYMFQSFNTLSEIPQLDTSSVTNMYYMFYNCSSLTTIPQLDTSKVTNMNGMFGYCRSLTTIPQLDTSSVTNMNGMFGYCSSLTTIPQLDTSKVTNMSSMFNYCSSLTTIPQLDTSSVTYMSSMFYSCSSLTTIPQLDTSSVTSIGSMFIVNNKLTNMGGLKNLGMAYLTTQSANYYQYTLDLSYSPLTHDSLMNVINNLYDIASAGVQPQKLQLGATNKAKLESTEEGRQAIASAQNKGWSIS